MKSSLQKQVLVFVMLLSLIGQAFATTSICVMAADEVVVNDGVAMVSPPCHDMVMDTQLDKSNLIKTHSSSSDPNRGCRDGERVGISHDCACPDGGCTASIFFSMTSSTRFIVASESAVRFADSSFISQISSALFRPPIV